MVGHLLAIKAVSSLQRLAAIMSKKKKATSGNVPETKEKQEMIIENASVPGFGLFPNPIYF